MTSEASAPARNPQGAGPLKYLIEPMQVWHVPAVSAIEKESFSSTWPGSAYRREIERNQMAHYFVARRLPSAGPARRGRRFPIAGLDGREDEDGLLAKLVRMIRGEARNFSPDEAEQLESIVGYTGMWLMIDEAHVTTIAVDPAYRGEGIGEFLLLTLIDHATDLGAAEMTLECRVSNHSAQALYRKYTFRNSGLRKRYYSDDGEDALIMTTEPLDSQIFQQILESNRARLLARLSE